eukprot:CAMPEP_0182424304 /NCGR_PEP_ID=MMETSP1167-20130531/10489_1 /TAXON_ID=2988 /ORGANISM="Mallomonas Sp, Strain CCMP3275" /LENGTH=677 /DNA_ID=CAMNT_0024604011 /DNA_START=120 /DNA_END=2153 /DNA_ORIENTATION=+
MTGKSRFPTSRLMMVINGDLSSAPKIIIAGAPASGKGTQCSSIVGEFGVIHLSTGDILRAAVSAGTELGLKAKEYMDAGQLVPDELITGVIKDRLAEEDCKTQGWLLDGFPRTAPQADALAAEGLVPDCFVMLDVPEEVLVERVTGRRTDPVTGKIYHMKFSPPEDAEIESRLVQRSDDTEEKIVVRFREFQKNIDAVKANYADREVWVDGTMSPDEVSQCLIAALTDAKKKKDGIDDDDDDSSTDAGAVATSTDKSSKSAGFATVLGLSSLLAADRALANTFRKMNVAFPSSLAGMVVLFGMLCFIQSTAPKMAEDISDTLSPAVALLKAWLPLFFVPPLVILPTKMKLVKGAEAPFGLVLVAGLLASLVASATSLSAMQMVGIKEAEPQIEDAVKSYPTPGLPPIGFPLIVTILGLLVSKAGVGDSQMVSKAVGMSSSIMGYITGTKVPDKIKKSIAHPVLTCASITFIMLNALSFLSGVPLSEVLGGYFGSGFSGAGDVISAMLGPAVLSFGLQLYQYRGMLKRNAVLMTTTTITSALFGLTSSAILAGKFLSKCSVEGALSPLTRCITTPLALAGARLTGADESLSAFFVVITGILGASFGERILSSMKVKGPVSVGISMGASAHGLGAASVSYDAAKFAAALVSMTLTGLWTVCLLSVSPIRNKLMKAAIGI